MKKKINFLLIGLVTCLSFSFTFRTTHGALSQDWIAIEDYKNDYPTCLSFDSSGNIYVAGYMDNFYGSKIKFEDYKTDIFLFKYDPLGVKQWNRTYDVQKREICNDLILDSQDNAYLVGSTSFGGPYRLLLLKYNSSGHLQWNKTWGEDIVRSLIKIDAFDNIMVGGEVGEDNVFLHKYDTSGNLLWNRTWETPAYYSANAMALDSSNNIFIGGSITINTTSPSILVLSKYNNLGEYQWNLTYQTFKSQSLRDVIIDSLDNIYFSASGYGGEPDNEVWLLKCDSSGSSIWNATWEGGATFYSGLSLAIDASDNIYITGGTNGYIAPNADVLVLKYNSTGDLGGIIPMGFGILITEVLLKSILQRIFTYAEILKTQAHFMFLMCSC